MICNYPIAKMLNLNGYMDLLFIFENVTGERQSGGKQMVLEMCRMQEVGVVEEERQKILALPFHGWSVQFTRSLYMGLPWMSGLYMALPT